MTTPEAEAGDSRFRLREVENVAHIKGVPFDAAIRFRQLLITGPPGSGKSTLVRSLGGWPDEGYLDLTKRRWWRSRILTFRPREVHLGLPFGGQPEALASFEKEWVDADAPLELELERIQFPPPPRFWGLLDWRNRFVFEFLLPPAEKVFAGRQQRSYRQTHPVDVELSLDQVKRQIAAYWNVAHLFHRSGLIVFVRVDHGEPPRAFADDADSGDAPVSPASDDGRGPEPSRPSSPQEIRLPGSEEALRSEAESAPGPRPRVVRSPSIWDGSESVRVAATKLDVRLSDLPVSVKIGPQRIEVHRETPLDATADHWPGDVLLLDPDQYYSGIGGFVRLEAGARTRIGKGEEDRQIASRLPREMVSPLEISNTGSHLRIVDLHSASGTVVAPIADQRRAGGLSADREERLAWVRRIYGGPLRHLESEEAFRTLEAVIEQLETAPYRPHDSRGLPGALVELPADLVPIIAGDFHGNLDNLLKILSEGRFLDELEDGRAALILLGDAVHREEDGELEEMLSSVTMMDLIFRLRLAFPGRIYYLQGNHDSFSPEVTKEGVAQGRLWRRTLERLRGREYAERMQRFYDLSPVVVASTDFVACHAGPPQGAIDRRDLVELHSHPRIRHQVTWNRLKRPGHPAGYGKRDVKVFRRALGLPKKAAMIVSHNPRDDGRAVWWNYGGIKDHHMVYTARQSKLALITRVGGELVPLTYRAERLLPRMTADPGR